MEEGAFARKSLREPNARAENSSNTFFSPKLSRVPGAPHETGRAPFQTNYRRTRMIGGAEIRTTASDPLQRRLLVRCEPLSEGRRTASRLAMGARFSTGIVLTRSDHKSSRTRRRST